MLSKPCIFARPHRSLLWLAAFSAVGIGISNTAAVGQEVFAAPSKWTERVGDIVGEGVGGGGYQCACEEPGTLMQWSYGPRKKGGPDLSAPLVTDRPDFTEASSTVGRGVAQIEFGYTYFFDDDGTVSTKTNSYPEPLLRYGILKDWLELRVAWNYNDETVATDRTAGANDLYLGFKIGLTPQEGILPEMALIPQMFVPTGHSSFTSDKAQPGLNWIYAWEVNDFISTAGSTQFNNVLDDGTGETFTEWAQSWTVAYSLSEKLGAYTEFFALFPNGADTALPQYVFNGGFTVLLSDDVQWDIRGGVGLNDAAPDYFIGTGLSVRFKNAALRRRGSR